MNTIFKNSIAVVVGWLVGSVTNMGLIQLGFKIMPVPGLDPNDMRTLVDILPTLNAPYFIFPFLGHAIGTYIGACTTGLLASSHQMKLSLAVGGLFFLGGVAVNYMLPGPLWFTATDLVIAYLPMAFLGGKTARKFRRI